MTRRATRGFVILVMRALLIGAAKLGTDVILARRLSPSAFAAYAIVTSVLISASFLGDFGVAGALIQKREAPTQSELATAFVLQQGLVLCLLALTLTAIVLITQVGHLPTGVGPAAAIVATVVAAVSLKTIPTVLLERLLVYDRLALVDVTEWLLFFGAAVALSLAGFGIMAFALAAAARTMAGIALIYTISPWRPALEFNRGTARTLMSFGAPFQVSLIAALIKDNVIANGVAAIVGAAAIGFFNWALSFAAVPTLLASIASRVGFTSYSRLQHDQVRMRLAIEKTLRLLLLVAIPMNVLLVSLAPLIVHVVYTDKWLPALPSFYWLSLNMTASYLTTPLMPALNAVGRPREGMRIMLAWSVLCFILSVALVGPLGVTGVAMAYGLAACVAAAWLVRAVQRALGLRPWFAIPRALAALVPLGILCRLASGRVPQSALWLASLAIGFVLLYGLVAMTTERSELLWVWRSLRSERWLRLS